MDWMGAYEQKLKQDKPLEAFIVFIRAMDPMARLNPSWVLKMLLPRIMQKDDLSEIITQLPANLLEHKEVAKLDSTHSNYKQIKAKALILFGGKSPKSTKQALEKLRNVMSDSDLKEFKGLDHFGINKGEPALIAEAVRNFFSAD